MFWSRLPVEAGSHTATGVLEMFGFEMFGSARPPSNSIPPPGPLPSRSVTGVYFDQSYFMATGSQGALTSWLEVQTAWKTGAREAAVL
jgi:hypothetical protein